jgi:hypothetical protein
MTGPPQVNPLSLHLVPETPVTPIQRHNREKIFRSDDSFRSPTAPYWVKSSRLPRPQEGNMKSAKLQAFKKCVRIGNLILAACALIGPVANSPARSRKVKNQPVITVGVYNYAKIDQSQLRQAENHVEALFNMAGVRIAWTEYLPHPAAVWSLADNPAPDFSVRILYASPNRRAWRISGVEVMGESIIPQEADVPVPGGIANVFYDRVKEVASTSGAFSADVLGEAITHELGHLMLGPHHSDRGVMKVQWTSEDLDLVSHCELRFLPAQAVLLQHAARSLQRDSSPRLVAQR